MDDKLLDKLVINLEEQNYNILNTIVTLTSQGYIVNNRKYEKLNGINMLIHAYNNIELLDPKRQKDIGFLLNKISSL